MEDGIDSATRKNCAVCNKEKYISDFYKDARTVDGLAGTCKTCRQKKNKRWAAENPIRYYCSMLLTQAKRRQETRGHQVSPELSVDHLLSIATPNCPITGEPLLWEYSHGKGLDALSPSLDRIDSSKGYEPGNVRIISHRMNALKNNLTLEQINALHAYMNGREKANKGGSFASSTSSSKQIDAPIGWRSKELRADTERIEKIKRLREKGMTIRDIASSVGMSKSSVHNILREASAAKNSQVDGSPPPS